MPIIANQKLYNFVKEYADKIYEKPSAFKSGFIVKTYKSMGGKYIDDDKPKNLKRWINEKWINVSPNEEYPTFRPTKRINKMTPLTVDEIDKKNLKEQIKRKQIIKGDSNLPPFKMKNQ